MTAWESEIQQSIIDFNTLKAVLKLNDDEKELLYGEGQHVFKIVNKDQQEGVLLGIFLLVRRRKEVVLGVVVDHGLGQDLVLRVTLGLCQPLVHKCGQLVHVQRDIGDLFWFYVVKAIQTREDLPEQFFV